MRSATARRTARRAAPRRRSARIERTQTIAVLREAIDALVLMIAPFAPHTAEELWQMVGHPESLAQASWPAFDPEVARAEEVVVPVQINGKVRARLTVPAGLTDDELQNRALEDPAVKTPYDREDDPQSGGGEGATCQCRGWIIARGRREQARALSGLCALRPLLPLRPCRWHAATP